MKNKKQILLKIAQRRFYRRLESKRKKQKKRKRTHNRYNLIKSSLGNKITRENALAKWLPPNTSFLLSNENSDFHYDKIIKNIPENNGRFEIPEKFSLIEAPEKSYKFIMNVLGALITQKYKNIEIDYANCTKLDLGAQVLLDIILKDIILFFKKCQNIRSLRPKVETIDGKNLENENVRKLLFSVGSPVILKNSSRYFTDIVPYKLCIHNNNQSRNSIKVREQKDLDTTKLVDYVLDSLKKLNRTLTPEKIDDLSTVIGEILINAEEHSTLGYRFSIGYFHEITNDSKHYGVFRLVILNFGKTIYEKFSDPLCENKSIIEKMKNLSEGYTKRKYFTQRKFEEESLWTLYALQEGVSSVAPEAYIKRGNGTIQFIKSFFNIKGTFKEKDNISKMVIMSGNTKIIFDGTYNITNRNNFNFMTFNDSGDINEKPNQKFVNFTDNYFPGTIISVKLLFNEDDFEVNYEKEK